MMHLLKSLSYLNDPVQIQLVGKRPKSMGQIYLLKNRRGQLFFFKFLKIKSMYILIQNSLFPLTYS